MSKTVLVTGASGFLASYVIAAFLDAGWTVVGSVRSEHQIQSLLDRYPAAKGRFSCVVIKDLVTDHQGIKAALQGGVQYIAHTASPYQLTVTDPMKDFIDPAVQGTLSILKAAKEAGIKRVVVTSSFAAVTNFNKGGAFREYTYTAADWNPTTLEQALEEGRPGAFVYSASKTFAERAALDFGVSESVQVVTLQPPMIYGSPLQDISSVSTINTSSAAIYSLISGPEGRAPMGNRLPLFCSVEDVALAHVKALEAKTEDVVGKRFLLCGGSFTWEDAIEYLATARPALASRLPKLPEVAEPKQKIAVLDCTPALTVLGMPPFMEWKEVLLKTIDHLVAQESSWKK